MGLGGYFRILLPFFPLQRFASLSRFVETLVVAEQRTGPTDGSKDVELGSLYPDLATVALW